MEDVALWQLVEDGDYHTDIPAWLALADRYGPRVLEVGAGAGRVTTRLQEAGHQVVGLDLDLESVEQLRAQGIPAYCRDATQFVLPPAHREFDLIACPLNTVHQITDRAGLLRSCVAHLAPDGAIALSISGARPWTRAQQDLPPRDERRIGEHHYASQALGIHPHPWFLLAIRERTITHGCQLVSRRLNKMKLWRWPGPIMISQAAAAGLELVGRISVPPADGCYPETIVLLCRG